MIRNVEVVPIPTMPTYNLHCVSSALAQFLFFEKECREKAMREWKGKFEWSVQNRISLSLDYDRNGSEKGWTPEEGNCNRESWIVHKIRFASQHEGWTLEYRGDTPFFLLRPSLRIEMGELSCTEKDTLNTMGLPLT